MTVDLIHDHVCLNFQTENKTVAFAFRNLMLKVSILGVLCYHWLGRVAADSSLTV